MDGKKLASEMTSDINKGLTEYLKELHVEGMIDSFTPSQILILRHAYLSGVTAGQDAMTKGASILRERANG